MLTPGRRQIALALLVLILPQLTGCKVWRTRQLDPREVPATTTERIVGVTTVSGQEVQLDAPPRNPRARPAPLVVPIPAQIRNDTLFGSVQGTPYLIPIDSVQRVWVDRVDSELSALATFGAVVGVISIAAAVLVGIAIATKESCPFVYSWDGEKFVFDAEPYGGAITRGLERDDFSELEHLRSDGSLYRLMVTNEVNETQYTNLLSLRVVDHPEGIRAVADEWGTVHAIGRPQPPLAARSASHGDLLPWLEAADRRIWEPLPDWAADGGLRDEIVLTFPKPPEAKRAKLLARVATGLWGSHMIRAMLELRGRSVGAWYAAIDAHRAAADALLAWNLREELYLMKVQVEEPSGWQVRGILPGGGPFIAEDRVVPLDVSGVRGDQLRIRIRPPAGFWALNAFAIDYTDDVAVAIDTLAPIEARDAQGRDVLPDLRAADGRYYEMPTTADRAFVTFRAPPPRDGLRRTVILHSRGYYRLHLPEGTEPDSAALRQITEVPGAAARLAADLFREHTLARRTRQ
jgi:hypothetical protein